MQYSLELNFQDVVIKPEEKGFVNLRKSWPGFKKQLLKWIGNKQRFAHQIIGFFPERFGIYREPFLGSGGVLGVLAPNYGVGSDSFKPLIGIWQTLKDDPQKLKKWYSVRWEKMTAGNKVEEYEKIKASYNRKANSADLVFLSRSCYGGVVRFRQTDGYMSTPCGIHNPISPKSFGERVDEWHKRVQGTDFSTMEYEEAMDCAEPGDLIYCDPPYSFSQAILYGAHDFNLEKLLVKIQECKERGVYVALSIDGSKKSGNFLCDVLIPEALFEREILVKVGRSMLKRFQMEGESLETEVVMDRLLLTY